jgi:two-component system sensor histidine kinase DctS
VQQRRIHLRALVGWDALGRACVRIDVDDNGPGLRGRRIDELSAPFFTTKADGMGMGLAICRSIVEAHHGRLEAHDSTREDCRGGACLSFTLPLADGSTGDVEVALAKADA